MNIKYLGVILFWGCSVLIGVAQVSSVIQFVENDWGKVLELAKEQNKLIFLDAYTTWCAPCKEMDKKVFTSHRLGNFYNEHFINSKMDMEKSFGPALAIRYEIGVFPSFLFLTPDGTLINKISGYQNTNNMIHVAHASTIPKAQMDARDKRFVEGDRHPDFMYNLFTAKNDARDGSHVPLIDEYFISQKDWSTETNIRLLYQFIESADDPKFDYLVDNRSRFVEVLGAENIDQHVEILTSNKIYNSTPEISLLEAEHLFLKIYGKSGHKMYSHYRMKRHLQNEEYQAYAGSCINHMEQYPIEDGNQLNYLAWQFYEHVEGKDYLNTALDWAKKSADLKANYYNHDTIAALYYKMKKKRKAKRFAKKAIKMAAKENIDAKKCELLLENINQL